MRIGIFTAEPENFVPIELKKAAIAADYECDIIDITKVLLIEGKKDDAQTAGDVQLTDMNAKFDIVIPRLNEHNLESKLGILRRLSANGTSLLNSPDALAACNDKLLTQHLLNNANIPTPYTVVTSCAEELPKALEHFEFPMIMKTLRGTHGIGVMKVDSASSATSVAQAMMAREQLLLQEFIEHKSSYRIIMVGQTMLAANERGQPEDKDEFRTNSHLGSETKAYQPSQEELDLACRIVEVVGANFCAIDYIKVDDRIIVLEVNGSPGLENIQKNYPDRNLAADVIRLTVELFKPKEQATEVTPPAEVPTDMAKEPASDESAPQAVNELVDVKVLRIMDEPVEARVDTGAKYSSLHVSSVEFREDGTVAFTRGNTRFKVLDTRTVKIRNAYGVERRAIVKLDIEVFGKRFNQVEFSINDRSDMKYEVLLGRNVLGLLNMPITVASVPYDERGPSTVEGEEE